MPPARIDTHQYWEQRLASRTNLLGTGHRALNLENNLWLYRAQRDCLDQVVAKHALQIAGKHILDIGSGTGFYVDFFQKHNPAAITGLDISETSVLYLKTTFPTHEFYTADISNDRLPVEGAYEIISAAGVLYHIVKDDLFEQALANICRLLVPGGYLFVTDAFEKPLLPTASHARLRPLSAYRPAFEGNGLEILELLPVYYLSNRIYFPLIGPFILNNLRLGKVLYNADRFLRVKGLNNGAGLKLMLARKAGI